MKCPKVATPPSCSVKGLDKIAQKVGEEAEIVIVSKGSKETIEEASDYVSLNALLAEKYTTA